MRQRTPATTSSPCRTVHMVCCRTSKVTLCLQQLSYAKSISVGLLVDISLPFCIDAFDHIPSDHANVHLLIHLDDRILWSNMSFPMQCPTHTDRKGRHTLQARRRWDICWYWRSCRLRCMSRWMDREGCDVEVCLCCHRGFPYA